MYHKTCPQCGKTSYSAAATLTWICPYCSRDLSDQPSRPLTKVKHPKEALEETTRPPKGKPSG